MLAGLPAPPAPALTLGAGITVLPLVVVLLGSGLGRVVAGPHPVLSHVHRPGRLGILALGRVRHQGPRPAPVITDVHRPGVGQAGELIGGRNGSVVAEAGRVTRVIALIERRRRAVFRTFEEIGRASCRERV